jgi:dolichol-phosphate mannosyltransferase
MNKIIYKIPVYNEEKSAYDLVSRISEIRTFDEIRLDIFNDGSNRLTYEWLEKAKSEFTNLNINIYHAKENKGLLEALNFLITGFDTEESYNNIIFLDGDNTHNPQQIIEHSECLLYDLSIFSRYTEDATVNVSLIRKILSTGAGYVYRIALGINSIKEYTCLYRVFNISTFQELKKEIQKEPLKEEGFVCAVEMLFKINLTDKKIKEFPLFLQYDLKVAASSNKILQNIFRSLIFAFKIFFVRIFN